MDDGVAIDGTDDRVVAVRLVLGVDPPSLEQFTTADVGPFTALASRLRVVVDDLDAGDVDAAAAALNAMLAEHPAHPHLAREIDGDGDGGRWRLHHHPVDVTLVPMWTAICAEALARAVGEGHAGKVGVCAATDCERAFLDGSKNASRRFCSTACQNRVKAAAFRSRRRG